MERLGVVLFAAGGALRIWPVFVLGHRFSGLVAIQPGHTQVKQHRRSYGCDLTLHAGAFTSSALALGKGAQEGMAGSGSTAICRLPEAPLIRTS